MTDQRPLPDTDWARHSMCFVDGENLVARAQAFASSLGVDLPEGANFKRDTFIWPAQGGVFEVLRYHFGGFQHARTPRRSYYFAGATGAENEHDRIREQLWALGFEPQVFRRDANTRRSKGVDIALTCLALGHAYRGNYDVAIVVTGDGDYLPLVQEVKSLGKLVILAAFSNGLNPALRLAADSYYCLDEVFEHLWKGTLRQSSGLG